MIIKALCDYYDLLSNDTEKEISKLGYKLEKVSFVIELDYNGNVIAIHTLDKVKMIVFNTGGRSGSGAIPYILCDNAKYVLGKTYDKKTEKFTDYKEHFNAFQKKQLEIFRDSQDLKIKAFLSFLIKINNSKPDEVIDENLDIYKSGMIVFKIDGEYLHENNTIKSIFEKTLISENIDCLKKCMITGEKGEIVAVHDKIKGIFEGQAAGSALVSFNAQSFSSYKKEQNLNSPMTKTTADKYITAINYLISSKENKKIVGKTTVLIWAIGDKQLLTGSDLLFGNSYIEDKENLKTENIKLEEKILTLIEKYKRGININEIDKNNLENSEFYILGLMPNNARVCVQFFYKNSYSDFLNKITKYHTEMELTKKENYNKYIYYTDLLKSIATNDDKKNIPDSFKLALFYSITNGTNYPKSIYIKTIERIKAETSNEIGIRFSTQVSFIKAYLLRNINKIKIKEEITMSLNENSNNTPYLLGRIFAIFESVQYFANGSSNIRERYFQSASTNPKTIFSTIFNLYVHHIQKLKEGHKINVDKKIQELVSKIEFFPTTLTLEEQGMFILGYYHQRQDDFTKNKEEIIDTNK